LVTKLEELNAKMPGDTRRGKISQEEAKEDVIKDYDSVIRESSLLTTVCGFLFGFLLNISINTPKGFAAEDSIILLVALYSISFAVSFFAMPAMYHHLQYPYRDLEKFKLRSHRFMRFGIAPAAFTLYLGLVLGMKFSLHLGFTSLHIDNIAFVLAALPFVFIYVFFRERK
jgi:hypothetical protein